MGKCILAIDQGTTGTSISLIDAQGKVQETFSEDFEQIFPQPGWVEHDPELIWAGVAKGISQVLKSAAGKTAEIVGIGITNQRETVVVWDRANGKPIYNAIVWQCRRTHEFCSKLKNKGLENKIKSKTGLVLDPYFSASKVNWILENVPQAKSRAKLGELAMGTMDSFLVWKLSGGKFHVTDVSNASRTQLMNLKTLKWDPELLKIFSVPAELLPTIKPSSGWIAETKGVALRDGTPISGIAGDQQAALFGQACFLEGDAKCTFGTGSFLLMNTGDKPKRSRSGMLSTVAWKLGEKGKPIYALEGGAFVAGAAVQWLRDQLGIIKNSAEIESLAREVSDTGGVEFVPALAGLGAPYWDSKARGMICGLTRGSSRAHLARATLEAIALQNADILVAMEKDSGKKLRALRVDGGASANELLMQMQSDFLNTSLQRPANIETTTLGAAFLAGLGVGLWSSLQEIKKVFRVEKEFSPQWSKKKREERFKSWHEAVARTQWRNKKNK